MRAGLPAQLGERWLRNMLLNKWLDYCLDRGHRFAGGRRGARSGACACLTSLRRLVQRLAGREPSAEDERLVALFRNRASSRRS